ncbi:hypothetical protein GCM10025862_41680 [Arsenicicoccus piscis]|uniref:Uncharacterized protein n=1 Tax=Arsenicicoccus piscis TaxID=673954 RepID=A0ABQ6HUY3_9MICO|nr:hypothetical protein GCM10025862_35560 [Arsenicicoccus piscis]GMA22145.1 hypothetical protein GCM10025862_41680 [Arsenicicoccus piscis]
MQAPTRRRRRCYRQQHPVLLAQDVAIVDRLTSIEGTVPKTTMTFPRSWTGTKFRRTSAVERCPAKPTLSTSMRAETAPA